MRPLTRALCAVLALLGSVACEEDPLVVQQQDQPDRERLLGRPADIEAFIANSFNTVHNATIGGSNTSLFPAFLVMGLESYSGNSNFAMATRGAVPRFFIDNSRGNLAENENVRDWQVLHRAARQAMIGLKAFDTIPDVLLILGANRRARGRAFAWFGHGVAIGTAALVYDSVTLVTADNDLPTTYTVDDIRRLQPLLHYRDAMDSALASIDSAIAIAAAGALLATATPPDTSNFFPLPASWLNTTSFSTSGTIQRADFIRIARSYKARLRASVARDTTERRDVSAGGIVDWNEVIADAQNGIQRDFAINATGVAGAWDVVWPIQHYLFQSWHQMWSLVVGMADSSGAYDAWLAASLGSKAPFVVATRDRRFPRGTTRDAQIADSPTPSGAAPRAGLYFRNRPPGEDVLTTNNLANSYYDFVRFQGFRNASRIGTFPIMTRAEMNALIAEGAIRTGQWALAAQNIDSTRVGVAARGGGLPSVAGITNLNTPVGGGVRACVPKVPDPATNYTSATCGNIFEAMKWEFRMETAFTAYGMWYFAGRGWGDLPEGTPVHFPVPYQEVDTRAQPFYNMGGIGRPGGALRGTYGL